MSSAAQRQGVMGVRRAKGCEAGAGGRGLSRQVGEGRPRAAPHRRGATAAHGCALGPAFGLPRLVHPRGQVRKWARPCPALPQLRDCSESAGRRAGGWGLDEEMG